MTPRRRALLLGGLSLVLGALAASDVAGREARMREQLGPLVPVVTAARDVPGGRRLTDDALALRRVPARYAPRDRVASVALAVGERVRAPVAAGADVSASVLGEPPAPKVAPLRSGERVAELVAAGDPAAVVPGARVDVLLTRGDDERGTTRVALADVEVVAVSRAPAPETGDGTGRFLAASLRTTARQAVYLTAAQSFAREIRLLARPADDRRSRGLSGLEVGGDLGAG